MRRICTAVVLGLALMTAAPAAADVYDDNPAAVSRGPNDVHLFARGSDGALLWRHFDGSVWGDWTPLGISATSGPAAVAYGGAVHVFVRGPDGGIYQDSYANGAWNGWSALGGYATSAPGVAVRRGPLNYLDLVVKGSDDAIYFQSYVPGSGWSGFSSIGGHLTSAATVDSQQDGIVNVFSRGTDGSVYQKSWNGSQWIDWFTIGGGIVGAPESISRAPGYVNVYVRGAGNQTYARSWAGDWTPWTLNDTAAMDSSPSPYSNGPGHEAIVARHGANLWVKTWTSSTGWGEWSDLGPIAVPAPPVPTAPSPDGEVFLEAGLACTPPGGKLRVHIAIRKQKGKARARVSRIVFFTKGKGKRVAIDHRAPFVAHLKVNKPAGQSGRVYARVYFRRSKHGKLHHKTVSRRFVVCG
jgi:hypothetical protein